jgi:hypothetical protein
MKCNGIRPLRLVVKTQNNSHYPTKLLPMIGMLTQNEPQPYFNGVAKPNAITENSTQFICIREQLMMH